MSQLNRGVEYTKYTQHTTIRELFTKNNLIRLLFMSMLKKRKSDESFLTLLDFINLVILQINKSIKAVSITFLFSNKPELEEIRKISIF